MPKTKQVPLLQCVRCGHRWLQRGAEPPGQCPNKQCRSSIWDRLAKKTRGKKP